MESGKTTFWINRLFNALGTSSQKEIANILEVRQSTVSSGLRQKSCPPSWLIKILKLKSINPEWINYGDSYPKYMLPAVAEEWSVSTILARLEQSFPGVKVSVNMEAQREIPDIGELSAQGSVQSVGSYNHA